MEQSPTFPLDREAFKSALSHGLGRAWLQINRYGLAEFAKLVLDACLTDQTYDPQCEPNRADWLFSMFANAAEFPQFRSAILKALATETESHTLEQLCHLAKEMAARGDTEARQILRKRVFEKARSHDGDAWLGADAWVELEGVKGALELAQVYGEILLTRSERYFLPLYYDYPQLAEEFEKRLHEQSNIDAALQAYLKFHTRWHAQSVKPVKSDEDRKQEQRIRYREKNTLETIIRDAKNGVGDYPVNYNRFGRHATAEELNLIFNLLLTGKDETVITRLLWVFRGTPLPALDPQILAWADGSHPELRTASIGALSQLSHPLVHALARSKASNYQILGPDSRALGLFFNNFVENDDAHLIAHALQPVSPDRANAHDLGFNVLDIAQKWQDPALAAALEWVYANTPCSTCRYRALVQLKDFDCLSEWVVAECLHDASKEIREFAGEMQA